MSSPPGVHLQDNGTTEQAKLVKAVELSHFYVEATNQMMLLDIEITQPHVSAQLEVLWNQSSRPRQPQQWHPTDYFSFTQGCFTSLRRGQRCC